jgi:[protein-PII] uridylyltransferase
MTGMEARLEPALRTPSLPPPPDDDKRLALERVPIFAPDPAGLTASARAYLDSGREVIQGLHRSGASGRTTVRATSELMDRLLRGLYSTLVVNASELPPIALAAVGGYGRRELAPRSDLDVILVWEGRGDAPPAVARFAEQLLYVLWDLKLEVGWGARTPQECAKLAESDHTARTALVDSRPLVGSPQVYQRLEDAVLKDLVGRHAAQFIVDKAEELRGRRVKYGDTVFLLEPNLKQSEGGLRDLQTALWMARARFRTAGISDLLHRSVLPPGEVSDLMAARDFMWRVRNELHYLTGRKEDRLTFELQIQVAERLGYAASGGMLAVERFMHHYYLAASVIKRAADALVARCEESGQRRFWRRERKLDHEFKIWNGRITIASADLFEQRPAAIVRFFAAADREGLPLYSWARDRVAHELGRLDEKVAALPEVATVLRQMFMRPGTRGEFLLAMHELGVLARVIPEFGPITARAQHDMYHVYTVDIHSIFAVMRLYALRNGELAEQAPAMTRLMQELERPLALFLATLMHDAGKTGIKGHAVRGAGLMKAVADRLRLTDEDSEDAVLLVREHLLMSHLSQRRDLSDAALVEGFARQVGSVHRLKMLYLLTYADMCSVAPSTWNDWRARLLEQLFVKATAVFEGKPKAEPSAEEALRRAMLARRPEAEAEVNAFLANVPERYARTSGPRDAARHLRLLRRSKGARVAAVLIQRAGYTDLTITAPDRPGLLAAFSGALAAHRIDIIHAEVFSTADGRALDVFTVRGRTGGPIERDRWRSARQDLKAILRGQLEVGALLKRRTASSIPERFVPRVATHIAVDNKAAADATVIDVIAQDRIGLLHVIARTFFESGVQILLAKIETQGARAIDGFYLRKGGKKIEDPDELASLEGALRAAIAQGP